MGRIVAETVGRRLGRTLLELGGNNGVIVTKDANLDLAVRAVLFGAAGTAGQRCTSIRRLFLDRGIAGEMIAKLKAAYQQIRVGDPMDESTLMGPLIDRRAVDAMQAALHRIRAEGGEVILGGEDLGGCYVRPALVRARHDMPILKEEIFAPILYLIEFDTLEQALAWHNDVPQGLSSAMFTTNLISAETFLERARIGLRNRQYQHRHQRRGDRRSIRRRERHRRRPRIGQRRLEGLHAPPDRDRQLVR